MARGQKHRKSWGAFEHRLAAVSDRDTLRSVVHQVLVDAPPEQQELKEKVEITLAQAALWISPDTLGIRGASKNKPPDVIAEQFSCDAMAKPTKRKHIIWLERPF